MCPVAHENLSLAFTVTLDFMTRKEMIEKREDLTGREEARQWNELWNEKKIKHPSIDSRVH